MDKFYLQEINRIESEVEKIECMLSTRENKKIALKSEHKALIERKASNWQDILIIKTKIENFETQTDCLIEVAESYKKQANNYKKRLSEEKDTGKFMKLKLN